MLRVVILVVLLGLAVFLLLACGSNSTTSPDDDPGVGDDYTIPPYEVLRHGFDLEGVWANALGSISVGEEGMAFVTTAEGRFMLPSPTHNTLTDVCLTPEGIIFITSESRSTTGGTGSRLYRYQNGYLHTENGFDGDYTAISGSNPSGCLPAYAAHHRRLKWFDGHTWELSENLTANTILDIWPAPTGGLWAPYIGGVAYFDYFSDAFRIVLHDGHRYEGISGVAVDSVMTVGGPVRAWRIWRLDPDWVFQPVYNSPDRLFGIDWVERDYALVVGAEGATVEYDGAGWIPRHVDPPIDLKAVDAWQEDGVRRAVAVGDSGGVFEFFQGQWTGGSSPKIDCTELMGVSPSLMYALQDGNLMQYDSEWHALPEAGTLSLHDFYCLDADTVWAVGKQDIDNFFARYDGTSWYTQWFSSMDEAHDIWAYDSHNVFLACDNGTVHSSASFWAPMTAVQPPQHLRGVWGASPTSVYVVGDNGAISHWDGFAWTPMDSGTDRDLTAVWGSADNNVVAVGERGVVLRYNGNAWVSLESRLEYPATMVWCDGPDNIWVASIGAEVEHHNGTGWEERNPQLTYPLQISGLWGQGEDLFLLGNYGLLLRYASPPIGILENLAP